MCGGKRLFLFFYMNKVPWMQIMGKTNHHYTNNVQHCCTLSVLDCDNVGCCKCNPVLEYNQLNSSSRWT